MSEHEEIEGGGDASTKDCPFCGEEIKKAAVKCRHCGEHLKGAKRRRPGHDASRKRIDDAANLALIMGILSFVVCPCLAIVAIIKGNEAKRLALSSRQPTPGGATAGVVIGWIVIALNVLVIGAYVLIVGVVVAGGAAGS